jgi:hypothetical protein
MKVFGFSWSETAQFKQDNILGYSTKALMDYAHNIIRFFNIYENWNIYFQHKFLPSLE